MDGKGSVETENKRKQKQAESVKGLPQDGKAQASMVFKTSAKKIPKKILGI